MSFYKDVDDLNCKDLKIVKEILRGRDKKVSADFVSGAIAGQRGMKARIKGLVWWKRLFNQF